MYEVRINGERLARFRHKVDAIAWAKSKIEPGIVITVGLPGFDPVFSYGLNVVVRCNWN